MLKKLLKNGMFRRWTDKVRIENCQYFQKHTEVLKILILEK